MNGNQIILMLHRHVAEPDKVDDCVNKARLRHDFTLKHLKSRDVSEQRT